MPAEKYMQMRMTCSSCLEEFYALFKVDGDCITTCHTGVLCAKCKETNESETQAWEITTS